MAREDNICCFHCLYGVNYGVESVYPCPRPSYMCPAVRRKVLEGADFKPCSVHAFTGPKAVCFTCSAYVENLCPESEQG